MTGHYTNTDSHGRGQLVISLVPRPSRNANCTCMKSLVSFLWLRSLYPLSTYEGSHWRKKYQALTACTSSISCSGADEPGNKATRDFACVYLSRSQTSDQYNWPGNEATSMHAYKIRKWCPLQQTATPLNPILHFWSLISLALGFCISRKGGTGGGGWGLPQGAVHMAVTRLGCKRSWLVPGGPILTLAHE